MEYGAPASSGIAQTGDERRQDSSDGAEIIDVETTDLEDEGEMTELAPEQRPFLGLRPLYHKQRKRLERKKMKATEKHLSLQKRKNTANERKLGFRNRTRPPAIVDIAQGQSTSLPELAEHTERTKSLISQEVITVKKHSLFFNETTKTTKEERLCPWKTTTKTSPSVIDLVPRLPTVICS
jgi:hypothetical protein